MVADSKLGELVDPTVYLPGFYPVSSAVSVRGESSLFARTVVSSGIVKLLVSPVQLSGVRFSPFYVHSDGVQYDTSPRTSISERPFLPR